MQQSDVQPVVFEVDGSWQVPDLASVTPVGGEVRVVSDHGSLSYFDTTSGRLRALGLTLQQRLGDDGAQWMLVLPGGGAQAGLRSEPGSTAVPPALERQLEGVRGGESLVEVAAVTTERDTHQIVGAEGEIVAELADTRRHGVTLGATSTVAEWRQVDLRPGSSPDGAAWTVLRKLVKRSGAVRTEDVSDLGRMLGSPDRVTPDRKASRRVGEYISDQCAEILLCDLALRDHSDARSVHRMRVAIRRLRSVVTAFPILLEDEAVTMAADLRWLAGQLGPVRDLDVLDARVMGAVRALPTADLVGPVSRHLAETLALRRADAWDAWQRAWGEARYDDVMAAVGRWHTSPPVVAEAKASVKKVLARSTAKLDRSVGVAAQDPNAWHDARKAAKRLRYVSEVVVPLHAPAAATLKRAKRIQTQLGEHRDAAAAAQLLNEQGRAAGAREDDNGFSYGLLLAEQRRLAARALKGLSGHV